MFDIFGVARRSLSRHRGVSRAAIASWLSPDCQTRHPGVAVLSAICLKRGSDRRAESTLQRSISYRLCRQRWWGCVCTSVCLSVKTLRETFYEIFRISAALLSLCRPSTCPMAATNSRIGSSQKFKATQFRISKLLKTTVHEYLKFVISLSHVCRKFWTYNTWVCLKFFLSLSFSYVYLRIFWESIDIIILSEDCRNSVHFPRIVLRLS